MTALAFAAVAAGAIATALTRPRQLSLLMAGSALAAPLLAPQPLVRAGLGLVEIILLMRAVDLYRLRETWSFARRLWHLVSLADSRLLGRAPPTLDAAAARRLALFGAIGASGTAAVLSWPSRLDLLFAAVTAYALVEVIWASAHVTYAALGFTTPALHRLPLASTSIRELWGERWTQPVRHFMQQNIVRKLARRSLRVGLLLSFVASGLAHGYVVLLYAGVLPAIAMAGFFTLNGLLVLIERPLKVEQWPTLAARAWTVTLMLALSPLFTWPMLLLLPR